MTRMKMTYQGMSDENKCDRTRLIQGKTNVSLLLMRELEQGVEFSFVVCISTNFIYSALLFPTFLCNVIGTFVFNDFSIESREAVVARIGDQVVLYVNYA